MELEEALRKLFSLHQFGIKLGLDNIKNLLNHIGNPEKELKAFHIAGSNGKGSTASFISSILMEAGFKTGLYTSPHFVKFNERIRINGYMIKDDYVKDFVNDLNDYIDKNSPTFFEITTAMAFKYFAENEVDYAIIETGLGGRLDATNVLNPLASIITTISKEHTNILTDSITAIAYEKGEIIKTNSKSFAGLLPKDAMKVIKEKSQSVKAKFCALEDNIEKKSDFVKLNSGNFHYHIYETPLPGYHQLINSALAVLTIHKTLGFSDVLAISRGINNVIKNSGIQGRYEIVSEKPTIIFDSAHNEEGIEVFLNEFKKNSMCYEKKVLIFGVMKDKNLEEMLLKLNKCFDEINVTSINYERATTIKELKDIAAKLEININTLTNPAEYIKQFEKEREKKCLVVLGSMYLLGKIKEDLLK